MWVKICANTNAADAALAAELGADAVGFVFAPSKRQVTAAQVAAITAQLPDTLEKIGVFPAADAAGIITSVEHAGLTGVQLHGALDSALIAELNEAFECRKRILQVVGYEDGHHAAFEDALRKAVAQPGIDAILLDTVKAGASGGTGTSFDWSAAAAIVRRIFSERDAPPQLIVAGGLNATNVAEAIALFKPYGVDVASGTESSPGRKDPEKLRAFLAAARLKTEA